MSKLTMRKVLILLALTLTSTLAQAAPIRLDLPTLFQMRPKLQSLVTNPNARGGKGKDYPIALSQGIQFLDRSDKPDVYDPANSYARWGRLDDWYTEVAIWRTLNGKAVVAVNYVTTEPPVSPCNDWPCGNETEVFAHNGTRFIDAPDDAQNMALACNSYVSSLLGTNSPETNLGLSAAVRKAIRQRAGSYRAWLVDSPLDARTQCFLPRKGTSVMVGIATSSIVLAQKEKPMPLLYFKFDKVRGTFTPSVQP